MIPSAALSPALRQEMRGELRAQGQQALATGGAGVAEHWEAVSLFVLGYVGGSRTFAPRSLTFMNEEHSAWCASILDVLETNRDEDPVTRAQLYAALIAEHAQASAYVEWMVAKSLLSW